MKVLLDTHAFIWWDSAPQRLSATAMAILTDPANEILLSDVCVWELVIKTQLSRLVWRDSLAEVLATHQRSGLHPLPISRTHILAVEKLPLLHRDPFDRLLIATSICEQSTLLSADATIKQYEIDVVW